jgi:hypothetical protein
VHGVVIVRWNDIYPGAIVYHKIYTHWGKGVVEKVVATAGLEAMFEGGSRRAIVRFEYEDGVARCNASALRPTPNKKKIREMVEMYQKRGVDAQDGGDRLIIPSR